MRPPQQGAGALLQALSRDTRVHPGARAPLALRVSKRGSYVAPVCTLRALPSQLSAASLHTKQSPAFGSMQTSTAAAALAPRRGLLVPRAFQGEGSSARGSPVQQRARVKFTLGQQASSPLRRLCWSFCGTRNLGSVYRALGSSFAAGRLQQGSFPTDGGGMQQAAGADAAGAAAPCPFASCPRIAQPCLRAHALPHSSCRRALGSRLALWAASTAGTLSSRSS